ncbi:aspartate 1-decarboxylase [Paenibacillus dendritiformis]
MRAFKKLLDKRVLKYTLFHKKGELNMLRIMHKSKIHRAKVTDANLNYKGSITIDAQLMEAANILENERVSIVNINNGARFDTYVITGERGKGDICLNGAAARLVQPDDLVIIISYGMYDDSELAGFEATVVHVDSNNRIV